MSLPTTMRDVMMPAPPKRRTPASIRVAQLGGALMMLGGAGDIAVRTVLPNHRELLAAAATVPATAEHLVLALLHALGGALVACGLAVILLLREAHRSERTELALWAALVALLAEGMNAMGMYRTGSPLFPFPLTFLLLVVGGATTFVLQSRKRVRE
jgi:hypothetical protein